MIKMTLMTTTAIPPLTSLDCPFCLAVHARTVKLNIAAAPLRDLSFRKLFNVFFFVEKLVHFIFDEKRNISEQFENLSGVGLST